MLALLYATGIRHNELVNLELDDYDATTGTVIVCKGKGHVVREAYVADPAIRRVIDVWLDVRRRDVPGCLITPVGKDGHV